MLSDILDDIADSAQGDDPTQTQAQRIDQIALLAGRLAATEGNYDRYRLLLITLSTACVEALEALETGEQRRLQDAAPADVIDLRHLRAQ